MTAEYVLFFDQFRTYFSLVQSTYVFSLRCLFSFFSLSLSLLKIEFIQQIQQSQPCTTVLQRCTV